MRSWKSAVVGVAAAATLLASGLAQAKDLRMISGWTPANKGTYLSEVALIKAIEETSKGAIRVRRSGPEAVPPFEQLQPVVAGVFDMIITSGAYHSGTTAIGMALDAVGGNPDKWREAGVWDAVDRHYQKLGLKAIAFIAQSEAGYHMMLKQPIGPDGGLKGKKVRGTVLYHPLIRGLGGAPVVLPGGEVYSALEKGVVDGASWPALGAYDLKWHEVAKYMVRPTFGISTLLVLMNQNAWNKLTEVEKKALLDAGRKAEQRVFVEFLGLVKEEEEQLKKAGVQIVQFSPENQAKVSSLWSEGVWGMAKSKNGAEAEALHKLVLDKKLGM